MVRKGMVTAGALLALVFVLGGWTFVRAAWQQGQDQIQDLKPLQLKLGELKVRVDDLRRALRDKRVELRKFEAQAESEQRSIDALHQGSHDLLREMSVLVTDLKRTPQRQAFVYAGLEYARPEVQQDIIQKKERHQSLQDRITIRTRSLTGLRQMVIDFRQAIAEKQILAESLERRCERIGVTIEMARLKSRFPDFGTLETRSLEEEAEALEAEAEGAIVEVKDTGIRPITVKPETETVHEIESYIRSFDS